MSNPKTAPATAPDARLERLEIAFSALQDALPAGSSAELAQLRESVADLAKDLRDQREQMVAAIEVLEALRAGRDPSSLPPLAAAAQPFPPPPSLARRVVGGVLRRARAVVRRLRGASDPTPRVVPMLDPQASAKPLPTLSVVSVGGESTPSLGSAEILAITRADVGDLPSSLLEIIQWIFALEPLDFVDLRFDDASPESLGGEGVEIFCVRRELWDPADGLSVAALARRPGVVRGKAVRLGGGYPTGRSRIAGDALRPLARAEQYFLSPRRARGTHYQPLRALSAAARGAGDGAGGGELHGAVLTASPVESAAALLLEIMARVGGAWIVFVLEPMSPFAWRRMMRLERFGARVYPLAGTFPVQLLAPLLAHLARRHGLDRWIRLGGADALESLLGATLLADFAQIEPPEELPWSVDAAALRDRASSAARASLRGELGLDDDDILITWHGDLVPAERPEDFVALAHRLRGAGFVFLLVGDGPLAPSVADMVRYYEGLAEADEGASMALKWLPSVAETATLWAASEICCVTAERAPLPTAALEAWALERPVVSGTPELRALLDEGAGRHAEVGDVEAWAAALEALRDAEARRAAGAVGRRLVERRCAPGAAAERWAALLAPKA